MIQRYFAALPVPAIGRWLYKYYYRKAARIVVPSKIIGERLAELLPGAADNIRMLYNPVHEAESVKRQRSRNVDLGKEDDLLPPDD